MESGWMPLIEKCCGRRGSFLEVSVCAVVLINESSGPEDNEVSEGSNVAFLLTVGSWSPYRKAPGSGEASGRAGLGGAGWQQRAAC